MLETTKFFCFGKLFWLLVEEKRNKVKLLSSMTEPFSLSYFPFLFPDCLCASQEGEKRGQTADQMAKVWLKKNKQLRVGSYKNKH